MEIPSESSNYRPGEPLRKWDPANGTATSDINLMIQKGKAGGALIRLVNNEELSTEDHLTFGRLNSWCVFDWWEPLVLLLDHPRIKPPHAEFLRLYAKAFGPPATTTE
jgi:hypothetical protein